MLAAAVGQGSDALARGDAAGAEAAFRRALALAPASLPVMNDLAIALAREGKEDEAVALYLRALELQPGDAVTERNLGVAYFRAKRYGEALPLLERSAADTRTYQAFALAGFDLFALDRYAEAVPYLEKAHALKPREPETLDMLGKAYLRTKNYAGMSEVFRQMMETNPASPEAHAMLAMAYDKLYREDDAIREFQAALAADANYPGIHTGLGVIYWRNDQLPQAEHEFREELSRHPEDPVANCTLGRILRRQNKPAEAAPYLRAALAVNPVYRDALVELAQARLSLGDNDGAITVLRRATALDANDAEAHYILGTALNHAGQPAEGAKERALCGAIRERERAARGTVAAAKP